MGEPWSLDLYFPSGAVPPSLQTDLQSAAAGAGQVRVLPLEEREPLRQSPAAGPGHIRLIGAATEMKVRCVGKGLQVFLLDTKERAPAEQIYWALWPRHPLYRVAPEDSPRLRGAFLPGMTTYRCADTERGVLIRLYTVPGDTPETLRLRIEERMRSAGLTVRSLVPCAETAEVFRSPLDETVLGALVRTSMALFGKGPDFEWEQGEGLLRTFGDHPPNTFALGPGAPEEALSVSTDGGGPACGRFVFTEPYAAFLLRLVQELSETERI